MTQPLIQTSDRCLVSLVPFACLVTALGQSCIVKFELLLHHLKFMAFLLDLGQHTFVLINS